MTRMTSDIDALTALFPDGMLQLGVQALHARRHQRDPLLMSPMLAIIMIAVVVPVMLAMTLWFRKASDRGYLVVRDRIADVLADLQESLSGIRIITAHNRRRHNIVNHDNVVGDLHGRQPLHGPDRRAIYGPGTEAIGVFGQAVILLIGGKMVLDGTLPHRRAHRVRALPHGVLRPDPAAGAALQHVPAGAGGGDQAARPARHAPDGAREGRRRGAAADRRARSRCDDVSFGYDPETLVLTTSTSRSPPARRSPSSAPPAPASRRSPSW